MCITTTKQLCKNKNLSKKLLNYAHANSRVLASSSSCKVKRRLQAGRQKLILLSNGAKIWRTLGLNPDKVVVEDEDAHVAEGLFF